MEIKMREKIERVGMEERVTFTELISLTRKERNEKTFPLHDQYLEEGGNRLEDTSH